ncbi:MAG TPA: tetratricopeptide repeat protein [Verrucomicrobiae bacterium]|nr:tetratricopeptide repeat protein [Verrucomicrobiae bacterium]
MKGQKFMPLVVIAAGLLAYHNSFTGPFIFDDLSSIQENLTIRHLWPIWQPLSPPHRSWLTVEGRPLINLSLAINYALGSYNVWGYHALNLTVHIFAGLTLLGIVRRTLLRPVLRGRFGAAANGLALATAVVWTVHPLQTESVTYVIQRAESIAGLFYLLTLYCFIRGVESPLMRNGSWGPRSRRWYGLSVAACAFGMASKEVMVSAPVMVMLYDRAFVSDSFGKAWRRRWPLYVALAGTWILLGFVLASAHIFAYVSTTAQQQAGVTWREYLATEPGVILYYLRLSVWPYPLCLDYYGWPIAKTWMSIVPAALVMAAALGATIWAWKTNSAWGFLGAWFFLILAPSSSVIPLDSPAYEHRMYLPLAAVVVLGVLGIHTLIGRRTVAVVAALAVGLGFLTWRRNQDYRSELAIWQDTVVKRPDNPRAHSNLGIVLKSQGNLQEAIAQYKQALRLKPDYVEAHNNLGNALDRLGKVQEAIGHWEQALRIEPDYPEAHYNLGNVLRQQGKATEAVAQYEQALRMNPDYAEAHNNLAGVLLQQGRQTEAMEHYEQALRVKPDYAEAHNNLGVILGETGRLEDAIGQYEQAVRINPNYAQAHYNLGAALERVGRVQEAMGHYEQALRIKPDYAKAQNGLARLRAAR